MGTRCVVTFIDDEAKSFSVYKHYDGNPSNIKLLIEQAKEFAWPLPCFEAGEFACAFIKCSKEGSGDVTLTTSAEAHGDLSYSYEVIVKDGELCVSVRHLNA